MRWKDLWVEAVEEEAVALHPRPPVPRPLVDSLPCGRLVDRTRLHLDLPPAFAQHPPTHLKPIKQTQIKTKDFQTFLVCKRFAF